MTDPVGFSPNARNAPGAEDVRSWDIMSQNMDKLTYDDMSQEETGSRPFSLLGWEALKQAAQCLKSVAHPVRLRMLELLLEGEYTVGELAERCEIDQPAASAHLGQLRDRGLLYTERDGRRVYYRVAAPAISGIVSCMRTNFGPSNSGNGCRG